MSEGATTSVPHLESSDSRNQEGGGGAWGPGEGQGNTKLVFCGNWETESLLEIDSLAYPVHRVDIPSSKELLT